MKLSAICHILKSDSMKGNIDGLAFDDWYHDIFYCGLYSARFLASDHPKGP